MTDQIELVDEVPLIIEARTQPSGPMTPLSLLQHAIDRDVDVERLSKLMDLQTKWEENEARKAFMKAMSECQSEMPRVVKNRDNKQTNSRYADLEVVNSTVMPVATKHGLSISFSEGSEFVGDKQIPMRPNHYRTVMILRHRDGYSETHFYDLPTDEVGIAGKVNKTPLHGKASSTSYAERYLLCQVFSITIAGEDTDGNLPGETLNEEQCETLRRMEEDCENIGVSIDNYKFIKWLSEEQKSSKPIQVFGDIEQRFFGKAVRALDKKYKDGVAKRGLKTT